MPDATLRVEIDVGEVLLDAEGTALLDAEGTELLDAGFTDVAADVRSTVPLTYSRGNSGRTIFDRVADIGVCTFMLDNSTANSAGTLGYYSPDNSSVRSSFGLDSYVRITLIEADTTEHEEWGGQIRRIVPDAGQYGRRGVMITAEDWMAHAARSAIRGITVQTNKRDDEILPILLALASVQPFDTDYAQGDDIYTYSLHDENSDTSSLIRVFQKLAMSGLGKIYMKNYNTLAYLARSDFLLGSAPVATLNNTMNGLTVTRDKSQRVYQVNVFTYPVELDTVASILWTAQRELEIQAGETITFDVHFRDANDRAVRVASTSLSTPVAGTDYKFSSVSESESGDMNGSLTISYSLQADVATVTLTNNAASAGYLYPHQIKGLGAYLYDVQTNTGLTGQPDGEVINIDMVYQDDVEVGKDIKDIVTTWFASDQSDVESVSFIANKSQALLDAAFLQPNELVTIAETVTGVSNNFFINGWRKSISNGGKLIEATWFLTLANQLSGVCILDLEGSAELDSTAYLGA